MEISIAKVVEAHLHIIESGVASHITKSDSHLTVLNNSVDDDSSHSDELFDDEGSSNASGTLKRGKHISTRSLATPSPQVSKNRAIVAETYFRRRANDGLYYVNPKSCDENDDVILLAYRTTLDGINSLAEIVPQRVNRVAVVYLPETLRIFDDVAANYREYEQAPLAAALVRDMLTTANLDIAALAHSIYYVTASGRFKRKCFSLTMVHMPRAASVVVTYPSIGRMIISAVRNLITHEWRREILGWQDMPGFKREQHILKILVTYAAEEKEKAIADLKNSSKMKKGHDAFYVNHGSYDASVPFSHIVQWTQWSTFMPIMFSIEELKTIRSFMSTSMKSFFFEIYTEKERQPLCIQLLLMGV